MLRRTLLERTLGLTPSVSEADLCDGGEELQPEQSGTLLWHDIIVASLRVTELRVFLLTIGVIIDASISPLP